MKYSLGQIRRVSEVMFGNFEMSFFVAHADSFFEPRQRSLSVTFLPQHDSDVTGGSCLSTPICKFVPVERRRSIATDAYGVVLEIAEIYLAAAVTGLRGS